MIIDISPEAVKYRMPAEQLIKDLEAMPIRGGINGQVVAAEASIVIRALYAALTTAQTETAAAYEAAADDKVIAAIWAHYGDLKNAKKAIRALTPADSKAALDRMLAEAEERGMREAAGIVDSKYAAGEMGNPGHHILAAIPKGTPHE